MNGNSKNGKNSKVPSKIYLFNSIWLHKMALAVPKAPPIQNEVIFQSWDESSLGLCIVCVAHKMCPVPCSEFCLEVISDTFVSY